MPHLIIIIDGIAVAVEHEPTEGGGARVASGVEPVTDWDNFDHPPASVQIFESDPKKMNKVLKMCEKLCE